MTPRSLCILAAMTAAGPAAALPLVPHTAIYDLSLVAQSEELGGGEARLAIELKLEDCRSYDLDFRFVARFEQETETTLVDRRVRARESVDGSSFDFETWTFVDGLEQSHASGQARTQMDETLVSMEQPVERSFSLPVSRFPIGHTAHLIENARAGTRIVESRLYDGDEDGENLLTSTAVILPAAAGADRAREEAVEGLIRWRVDESQFTADSDADGMPIFHTRYTLFENGVTDDLYLDFGEYAFEGVLSELTLAEPAAECG